MSDSNYDPNPKSSEVIFQEIVIVDGKQTVLEKIYPDYASWLKHDDSKGLKQNTLTKRQKKAMRLAEELKNYGIDKKTEELIVLPKIKPVEVKIPKLARAFRCDALEYEIPCEGHKKKAHIITRQATHLSGESLNVLGLCEAHEKWFNQQPLKLWYRFVKERYPKHFNYLVVKAKFIQAQVLDYLEVVDEGS